MDQPVDSTKQASSGSEQTQPEAEKKLSDKDSLVPNNTQAVISPAAPATTPPIQPPRPNVTIQNALDQIDREAQAGLQKLWRFSIDGWKDHLSNIEATADSCINDLLTNTLCSETAETKKEWLAVIENRRGKMSSSTGITDQIIGICQSVLAFGAGGLGLTLAFIDKASKLSVPVQKYLAIAGIFYVEIVIVSVLSLILYLLQARFRYPFLYMNKIGNAWPWFYYASLSPDVPRKAVQLSRKRLIASKLYAQDFVKFASKALNEDYNQRLRNELQQYFLLMSYQGYIHQFSLRLANLFIYGFSGSFMAAVIMVLLVRLFGL
jgi:hypothetical protein